MSAMPGRLTDCVAQRATLVSASLRLGGSNNACEDSRRSHRRAPAGCSVDRAGGPGGAGRHGTRQRRGIGDTGGRRQQPAPRRWHAERGRALRRLPLLPRGHRARRRQRRGRRLPAGPAPRGDATGQRSRRRRCRQCLRGGRLGQRRRPLRRVLLARERPRAGRSQRRGRHLRLASRLGPHRTCEHRIEWPAGQRHQPGVCHQRRRPLRRVHVVREQSRPQ